MNISKNKKNIIIKDVTYAIEFNKTKETLDDIYYEESMWEKANYKRGKKYNIYKLIDPIYFLASDNKVDYEYFKKIDIGTFSKLYNYWKENTERDKDIEKYLLTMSAGKFLPRPVSIGGNINNRRLQQNIQ